MTKQDRDLMTIHQKLFNEKPLSAATQRGERRRERRRYVGRVYQLLDYHFSL